MKKQLSSARAMKLVAAALLLTLILNGCDMESDPDRAARLIDTHRENIAELSRIIDEATADPSATDTLYLPDPAQADLIAGLIDDAAQLTALIDSLQGDNTQLTRDRSELLGQISELTLAMDLQADLLTAQRDSITARLIDAQALITELENAEPTIIRDTLEVRVEVQDPALIAELDAARSQVDAMSAQISALNEQINALSLDVIALTAQRSELLGQILELESREPAERDTVHLFHTRYRGTEVAFNDVPPDHRRVERIIIRPVGWAAGTVAIKGSDDPWWTDIAMEVSTGDIWGTGDYMMFINIPTKEWTYAAAMLDSLQVMDRRARTGLHIRQSYEPGSPFVFLAYQDGRASVNMRSEWGGQVHGHPDGGFAIELPILMQVNMTPLGFDARIHDVWTDSLLHSWTLPNYFQDKFYTGIATTSWRTDYITRAWYSLLNILDADPWHTPCRDGDGNLTDCPEDM